ncbi:unnamed protein product [Sphenostylis stenocarpa]|uniref:Uncharacterized protein n=1 Tax=Sphenostylis stenocarpa TaxID=92480 RepID=A0AA86VIM1_9FABA|nr:unnamed protein product [Sphenostylis stenocarpa]
MQAFSPNGGVVRVQSHSNIVPITVPLKPNNFAWTQYKSTSRITLRCNSQTQPFPYVCAPKSPRICCSNVVPVRCSISSSGYGANDGRSVGEWLVVAGEVLSTGFPLWVSIASVLGLMKPDCFNWVTPKLSIAGLNIIMLGMGMTLTLDDLRGVLAMRKQVLSGFFIQYSVSDATVCISYKQTLKSSITFRSRFDITWIMTPFLTTKLAGKYVAVDAPALLISTLQVVFVPVLAGAFLNQFFQPIVKSVSPLMPPIAVTTVAILCGNAIAQSSSAMLVSGGQVMLATFLLQASGFFFGYVFARLLGIDLSSSRAISAQVGTKNGVLAIVLATKHFGDLLTAVPGAVSIANQAIVGSILAGIWRRSVR